ncbi:MAG: polysaccharide deacetylase family protein [Roseimicrobium sp.]
MRHNPVKTLLRKLRGLGARTGLANLLARGTPGVRVLMHHGVGTSDHSESEFDAQLRYLAQNYTILPLSEIVLRLRASKPLPAFAVALTFDDGLRNNFSLAYPLLKKHGIPATFFVCPGLVESGAWIWTHEVRARLSGNASALARLAQAHPETAATDAVSFLRWMKGLPNQRRSEVLETVREATADFAPSAAQRQHYDLMNWEEIAALDPALIAVGSHSHTHPMLSQMSDSEMLQELKSSREALKERGLLNGVSTLCYPDGACNARVIAAAGEVFDGACGTGKGIVRNNSPAMDLPRIGGNSPLPDVVWRMWRPSA